MLEFRLPDIGEGLHEAEIVEWLVAEGDQVTRNQPVVEILTDKSQAEMPAPSAGVVMKLGGSVGDIVQVGELLIVIDDGTKGHTAEGNTAEGNTAELAPRAEEPATASAFTAALEAPEVLTPPPADEAPGLRPKASPSTRRMAAEAGIDLHEVRGSGPGGRILAADVEVAAAARAHQTWKTQAAASASAGVPGANLAVGQPGSLGYMDFGSHSLRGIRRATAKAMDLSWSTIPHVTTMDEVDATELMLARSRVKEGLGEQGASITPLALMMVAVARSLRRFPMMNASLDLESESITVHDRINISVAVASDRGLMVPVISDADQLDVVGMAHEIGRVSAAARAGTVSADDLAGSTVTVSNYGSNGGYFAAPIVRPGEACIVGFGAITKRPIVIDDQVVARSTLPVVLSADHRLIDGDVLAAFQADLATTLTRAIILLVPQ